MVQLALHKGLKELGDQGNDAVTNELWWVHIQNAFSPRKIEFFTSQQRTKVFESLSFLTEKKIKLSKVVYVWMEGSTGKSCGKMKLLHHQ